MFNIQDLRLRLLYWLRNCIPRRLITHEIVGLINIQTLGDVEVVLVFSSDIYSSKKYFPKRPKTNHPYLDKETKTGWYWNGDNWIQAELQFGLPFSNEYKF